MELNENPISDNDGPQEPDFEKFQDEMEPLSGYGRNISFNPDFVDITDSIPAALMLSQAVYWQQIVMKKFGRVWFYKTYDEWTEETRMKKHMLDLARKKLAKFLITEVRGLPGRLYYRLHPENIRAALKARRFSKAIPSTSQTVELTYPNGRTYIPKPTIKYVPNGRTTNTDSTSDSTSERGSRVRAKAHRVSDRAIEFVNAFRQRAPWYPRKLDPKQTARELSAAEYLLASSSPEELFALVHRVMSGFVGNRRKVAMVKDLWENLASLKAEYSETGGLTPEESARIAEISRNSTREKTEEEIIADWNDYVAYCASVGKQPDESAKPECLKRSKKPQDVLGGIDPHAAGVGL